MERINHHSVQFVKSFESNVTSSILPTFTLLRNDEILDEILKEKNTRGREDIRCNYVNFNENLRKFIKKQMNAQIMEHLTLLSLLEIWLILPFTAGRMSRIT